MGLKMKKSIKIIATVLPLFFSGIISYAQLIYKSDQFDRVIEEKKGDVQILEGLSKEQLNIFKPHITSYFKTLEYNYKDSLYLFSTEINKKVQDIAESIYNANQDRFTQKPFFILSTSDQPNAFCDFNGIMVVNTGLIELVDDEHQLAFVIAHELAHFILKHAETSMSKALGVLGSSEFKGKIKEIKRMEYNKVKKFENLMKDLAIKTSSHSRELESDADALAVELLKNTRFNLSKAIKVMEVLEEVDWFYENVQYNLSALYGTSEFPLDNIFLTDPDKGFSFFQQQTEKEKKLQDSLHTHPDCAERYKTLQGSISNDSKTSNEDELFSNIKELSADITLKRLLKKRALAYSYSRILYLEKNQNWAKEYQVYKANIFNQFSEAQKKHRLNSLCPKKSPNMPEAFKEFVVFIHNQSVKDFAKHALVHILNTPIELLSKELADDIKQAFEVCEDEALKIKVASHYKRKFLDFNF